MTHDHRSPGEPNEAGLLRTLLAHTPDFVYFKDRERRFVIVSRPFEALLGRPESEILGRRDEDLFPPEVAALTIEDDRRVIEDGIAIINKLEGSDTPDGSKLWVLTSKLPWRDETGDIRGLFGISKDITEHRRAEDALRAEAELAVATLDAQLDTSFLFDPTTGKALHWNQAFRDISGYSDEEIAKLPAPASYYSPADLERAQPFIAEVMARGSGQIELDLICKDGRIVPTEYKVAVIRDEQGAPSHFISIGRDVSERRRQDEAVRVQRERLVRFMDSATDSFHLVDGDYRVIEINDAAFGRIREAGAPFQSKDQLVSMSLLELYPFLATDAERARLDSVLRTGDPLTYDFSAEHPTRGTVHMTVRLFKVGEELGLIATDISERKRAEEERLSLERQMLHAQKLESLGLMAGGIAHDFNNILVTILGHADLALADMAPNAVGRDCIEEVVKGAQQAADLAGQMLAYSGQGRFEVAAIDLNELVEDMGHLLKVSTSKRAVLRYDLADRLPAIRGDATQVGQVVVNLITNASEALGDDDGVITLTTGVTPPVEGAEVYLQVTDTGCGMDEQTRQKMFDPFYTTKFTGRGLGMAAVQGIVHGHEGSIDVQSRPGEGTRIRVLFPAAAAAITPALAAETAAPTEASSGTILLVDDEPAVRDLGQKALERAGFAVLTAVDGMQALEVYREHRDTIRLILLDLTMPKMDGEECFHELTRLKCGVPIVLSSGYSEQEITPRFTGHAPGGFLEKPYRVATLLEMVDSLLEGKSSPS